MMNGFFAQVAILDLNTFDTIQTLELRTETPFTLIASGSNGKTLLAYGGQVAAIDMDQRTISGYHALPPANVGTIISPGDNFYILNIYSYQVPNETSELFVMQAIEPVTITAKSLAIKGPTWGFIADGQLYTYHNPTYGAAFDTSFRAIARLDLESDASEWWPLPDYWDAGDIAVVDSKIILTHARFNDPEQASGLYEFDPETGELTQLVHIPGASRIIPPSP